QRDPSHTGSIPNGPVPPLKEAWVADAGDPNSNFTTWPVVFAGIAYASVGPGVLAVDASTGQRKWFSEPPEGQTIAAPAVNHNSVFVPVPGGILLALHRESGAELWRFSAEDDLDAAPTLAGDRLYFGSAVGKKFYCVDATTGRLVWAFPTEFEPDSVPAVADGVVVFTTEDVGSSKVNVYALDANTGRELWRVPQQEANSSPSILDGKVIIGGGDLHVHALDLKTGRQVWKVSVPAKFGVRNSPALAFGDVFMADRIGNFYRLDGATGRRKWIFEDAEGAFDQSYPVVAGKTMYIGGGAGYVYALNTDTGKLLWRRQIGGFVMSGAADSERFYFGVKFRNEGLYAYEHDPNPTAATQKDEPGPPGQEEGDEVPRAIFAVLVTLSVLLLIVILVVRAVAKRITKKLR
ncbi:MAG: PQQ-binding-like beta-propeller repeat protein, partial [Actinomycetota bacterium]|nr:PQQ-binding-like beta-propeller repeat protein [Actinomycetota bacterium]